MKLRIRENTVRIRLTQSEVRSLADGETVEQITSFSPTERLISSVIPITNAASLMTFHGSRIELRLPSERIHRWAGSSEVGMTERQQIDDQHFLLILVEKDFECLHPGHEVNSDAFPNPQK